MGCENCTKNLSEYVRVIMAIKRVQANLWWRKIDWNLNDKVNILIGENGCGKSTLLLAIAWKLHIGESIHDCIVDYDGNKPNVFKFNDDLSVDGLSDLEIKLQNNKLAESFYKKLSSAFNVFFEPIGKHCGDGSEGIMKFMEQPLSRSERRLCNLLHNVALLSLADNPVILIKNPENGFHVNWQEHLIKQMTILAPNAQFIITTHSPAIIMNGWNDVFVHMKEITKSDDK